MPLTRTVRASALAADRLRAPLRAPAPMRRTAIEWHVRLAPLLWVAGLLHLAMAALLAWGAARRWPRGLLANAVIALWLAIGAMQMLSSVLNGLLAGDVLLGIRNAFSLTAVGWIAAGLALAAGAGSPLSLREQGDLFSRLAIYTLLAGVATFAALQAGLPATQLQSPVSLLLGDGEFAQAFTSIQLSVQEFTWDAVRTRLILLYPWAPALGIGSLGLLLVSSCADSAFLRAAGIAGGAFGVLASWSRSALLLSIACIALLAVLRCPPRVRLAVLVLPLLALVAAAAFSDHVPLLRQLWEAIEDARAGSSEARSLIYDESWRGFLQSPWIGWGWVGSSVHPTEHLPVGSHSSVFGTLYTGGLAVFLPFAAAMLLTTVAVLARALPARAGNHACQVALCLQLVLLGASLFESLYSLALPCYFIFHFIGKALAAEPAPAAAPAPAPPAGALRVLRPSAFFEETVHAPSS